jgi:hypothetical protein
MHTDAHSRGKKSFSCEYERQLSESVPALDFVSSALRRNYKKTKFTNKRNYASKGGQEV